MCTFSYIISEEGHNVLLLQFWQHCESKLSCTSVPEKNFMVCQTFVWWALYILIKFVNSSHWESQMCPMIFMNIVVSKFWQDVWLCGLQALSFWIYVRSMCQEPWICICIFYLISRMRWHVVTWFLAEDKKPSILQSVSWLLMAWECKEPGH